MDSPASKRLPERLVRLLPGGGIAAIAEGIELNSLWRWARLSVLVGVVVGFAAAGVYYLIEWSEAELLHRFTGTAGVGQRVWWVLLLLPTAGGLVAGLLIHRFASECRGAGTDQVIDAFHNRDGRIRRRVPLVKLLATIVTLGSGGSAGREGPMAHIGAGFGSYLATRMRLSARDRRLLLLAGAAGGISALFRTPLGAAIWALEILYRDDFESDGMFPCLISSVTAYSVATTIYDQGSLFHVPVSYDFDPLQLVFYAAMALACVVFGAFWVIAHRKISAAFEQARVPEWLKPAIGGALLGVLAIGVPWVFGTSYFWMQDMLRSVDDPMRQLPVGYRGFWFLLALAVAKSVATFLTVGSGGSGGKFAPALLVGGFVGGAFGLLFNTVAPDVVSQPGAFVLVGMGAFYAAVARVPLATIILVSELFGSYDLLVPLMFAEMITVLALRRLTMYEVQVENRPDSPAHLAEFTVDVLQDLRVADHYSVGRGAESVPADMNLRDFLQHVSSTADSIFVVRKDDALVGIVSLSNVRSVVTEQEFLDFVVVGDAMWPFKSLPPDLDLRSALRLFLESGYDHLPVVDKERPDQVLGMLSQQQVFAAYNAEILRRRLVGGSEDPVPARVASSPAD